MPLQIIRQDITKMQVDAIVNTTNGEKIGYSGVDLAVHTAAGKGLDEECAKLPHLELGHAQITGGYNLPCKYVIHTSGPVWQGGSMGESTILRSCYVESLKLAVKYGCESVAFPLISSGVYGYPKDQVLKFAVQTITDFLFENELTVYLCVFDKRSYTFSQRLFSDIVSFIDDGYAANKAEMHLDDLKKLECIAPPPLCLEKDEEIKPSRTLQPSKAPNDNNSYLYTTRRIAPTEKSPSHCDKAVARRIEEDTVPRVSAKGKTLGEFVKQLDRGFQETLFELIDKSGMTDVECYKRANVDKRVFSKIKSNKAYRPSKQTAIAFAISLRLDLNATQDLLAKAGLTLSRSSVFDKIITFFILNENYDIFEINEALFEFDQVLLGSIS